MAKMEIADSWAERVGEREHAVRLVGEAKVPWLPASIMTFGWRRKAVLPGAGASTVLAE